MNDVDVMRELAAIEADLEGPEDETKLMSDEQFDEEVAMAAEGRWSELDLDELPADFRPATVQELIDA